MHPNTEREPTSKPLHTIEASLRTLKKGKYILLDNPTTPTPYKKLIPKTPYRKMKDFLKDSEYSLYTGSSANNLKPFQNILVQDSKIGSLDNTNDFDHFQGIHSQSRDASDDNRNAVASEAPNLVLSIKENKPDPEEQ